MSALGLEHDATRDLSLLHALVHRAEVLERLDDNLRDDLAAKSKVEGLDGVLPVSDVRSDDLSGVREEIRGCSKSESSASPREQDSRGEL